MTVPSTYRYRAYGLCLASFWPLEGLRDIGPGPADIELVSSGAEVFEASAEEAGIPVGATGLQHGVSPDGCRYLRWFERFEFVISPDGRRIRGRPLAPDSIRTLHLYLLGPVLSFALVRMGIDPIHSTVLVVDGRAVALLGDTGYGKSSLAAAFLAVGHRLLTDDLLVVEADGDRFIGHPGPARLKLYPNVAERLLPTDAVGATGDDPDSKSIIYLDESRACREPVPLEAFYALMRPQDRSRNGRIGIRRLSQRGAFATLARNPVNTIVRDPERLQVHFRQAASIAATVPVKSLRHPRTLDSLPAVRDRILADLARDG